MLYRLIWWCDYQPKFYRTGHSSIETEILVYGAAKTDPPLVVQVHHLLLVLLSPLFPLVEDSMSHPYLPILVLGSPVVNADSKLVHMWHTGHTIAVVKLQ